MKNGLVELPQVKILDPEASNWTDQKQHSLCDRIHYGCKETLFNQLV